MPYLGDHKKKFRSSLSDRPLRGAGENPGVSFQTHPPSSDPPGGLQIILLFPVDSACHFGKCSFPTFEMELKRRWLFLHKNQQPWLAIHSALSCQSGSARATPATATSSPGAACAGCFPQDSFQKEPFTCSQHLDFIF